MYTPTVIEMMILEFLSGTTDVEKHLPDTLVKLGAFD